MKVLMFGWEFPPHILGGLGNCQLWYNKRIGRASDMEITFLSSEAVGR